MLENIIEIAIELAQRYGSGAPVFSDVMQAMRVAGTNKQWRFLVNRFKRAPRWLYLAYLGSHAWHVKRRVVMDAAKDRCERCIFAIAVHVHHKTYVRLGDEAPGDLAALCQSCHRQVHGLEGTPKIIRFLEEARE